MIDRIENTFASPSSVQIEQCEHQLGVSFPDSYREFLCSTNGGNPFPKLINVANAGDVLIDFLYGVSGNDQPGDLIFEQRKAQELDPLPDGLIVIGHDPGGNRFLLETCGEKCGCIFYWDSASFFPRSSTEEGNTYFVAESMEDFLEMARYA